MDWPTSLAALLTVAVSLIVVLGCVCVAAFLVLRRRATIADTRSRALMKSAKEGLETVALRVDALAAHLGRVDEKAGEAADGVREMREASTALIDALGHRADQLGAQVVHLGTRLGAEIHELRGMIQEVRRSFATPGAVAERRIPAGEPADALGDVGAAIRPDQELTRAVEEREFFRGTLSDSPIRPLPLGRMFPGIEGQCVEVGVIDPDTKHANHVDMLYVCAIARHVRARRIFEFGTYLGRTTYHLALGPDVKEVFTLDLDPSALYPDDLKIGRAVRAVHERGLQGHFFRDRQCSRRITQLHGDTRTFDYSPYHGRMDFVFVDGGHTYELISNDTEHAFALLKPGGVIVWHDFAPKGRDVVAFARDFSRQRPLFWVSETSLLVYVDGVNPITYDAPVPAHDRSVIKGSPESPAAAPAVNERVED